MHLQPAGKVVIKLSKAKPILPSNFEEYTWAELQSGIKAIFLKQPAFCELEKLYQAVNDLCLLKMGGSLYQRIEKECEAHISAVLQSLVAQSLDLKVFLSSLVRCWKDFCDQMLMIGGIASYLDRTYVKRTANVRSLWDMGMQLFRQHLSPLEVEHKTVIWLLESIERERLGEAVDRTPLSHLLEMFSALGIHIESFERPFLESIFEFHATVGMTHMQQSDGPDHLRLVEISLHEELERCKLYLDTSTRKTLMATAERQVLERPISDVFYQVFTMLMDESKIEDLQRMYSLFLRVNALESLRRVFSSYVRITGQGIVMDKEMDKNMVPSLLEFTASLDEILEESFAKNLAFRNTIKDAFKHFINLRQNRPAELIVKFLGEKLSAANKGTSEGELEATLDKVLVLLRFIKGNGVFEAFYKKDLAKRLLLGKNASNDAEKSVLSKLKTECSSQFSENLEAMFEDIELSKEVNESFKQSSQAIMKLPPGIEMSVHVLTTGYWPTYPSADVRLPHELNVYQDTFREFYLSKRGGRSLIWQNSLGHCVLKAKFQKGEKELAVSLFQTAVLMLFNDAQKLSFQDIKDATGIEDKELRRTLQSLACGEVWVLQKLPKGRDVGDGDSFVFNEGFAAAHYHIKVYVDNCLPAEIGRKVNAIQVKETMEENTSTIKRGAFQDHQYQVDAAIVRIMKRRKLLGHTRLITELLEQLKFPVETAELKKRIECLIDLEYLKRDESDPQSYHYVP